MGVPSTLARYPELVSSDAIISGGMSRVARSVRPATAASNTMVCPTGPVNIRTRVLSVFFTNRSADVLKRTRQLVVDQLCMATGGPCQYIGRDMKTVHAGMGITEANWDAAVQHLVATLAKFKVPDREQKELLAIASSLKNDVVDQKKM